MVGTGNASTNAPSDAAVVIAKPTSKALALTTDCNSRYVFADPYKGAMIAVSEAARNIVCSGGQPLGITNCLNFGNPYDPEVYYQFVHAIKGMGEACRKFDTPVTGGNVSFYNQNPDGAVYPTPTIGMVGLIEHVDNKMTMNFRNEGDIIFMLGTSSNDINSSEYLQKIQGVEFSPAPEFDLDTEYNMQQKLSAIIKAKLIESAHDVSEGGLFIALLEASFANNLGFEANKTKETLRSDGFWFGEAQSRVVVSVRAANIEQFKSALGNQPFEEIGKVTSGAIVVDGADWGGVGAWKLKYNTAIEKFLGGANN